MAAPIPAEGRIVNRKLLGIYLNDHLAVSAGVLALAGRAQASNRGTELGSFLEQLRGEIEQERSALEELMGNLGIAANQLKQKLFWLAEKGGRLKLNGSLTGYSPLSRLVELDGLTNGVTGKLSLWRALSQVPEDPILAGFDHQRFIERALAQLSELEQHRAAAARIAFAQGD